VKTFISLALAGLLTSTALAVVSVQVYRADEQTPLEWVDPNIPDVYRDIMVGTRLTLFVVSDAPASIWSGGLWVSWDDWNRGTIAGRGYNEEDINFDGSVLPASGRITHILDSPTENGMDFTMSIDTAMAGEWFVLDYHAEALGTCNVGLYSVQPGDELPHDFNYLFDKPPLGDNTWIQGLSFNHVPSRDHNEDSRVDFADFAIWATRWNEPALADPNMAPPSDPNMAPPSDPNEHGAIDARDLALFCTYWLERTDVNEPATKPNVPGTAL
jgi:hypothetical protein